MLFIIQFLSHGQSHWLTSIHTIFQWFTCYENSYYQQFMPNLCYIVYIDLSIVAFWFVDNYQWPIPNLHYIWLKWWTNSGLTFQFHDIIIKSFFKDIPNGRMGWSWKGPKVIIAGSLQLDIQLFITVIFTVLTFHVWC